MVKTVLPITQQAAGQQRTGGGDMWCIGLDTGAFLFGANLLILRQFFTAIMEISRRCAEDVPKICRSRAQRKLAFYAGSCEGARVEAELVLTIPSRSNVDEIRRQTGHEPKVMSSTKYIQSVNCAANKMCASCGEKGQRLSAQRSSFGLTLQCSRSRCAHDFS